MGKILVIKDADFGSVAVDKVTPSTDQLNWVYNLTDTELFVLDGNGLRETQTWHLDFNELPNKKFEKIKFVSEHPSTITIGSYSFEISESEVGVICIKDILIDNTTSLGIQPLTSSYNGGSIHCNSQSIGIKIYDQQTYFSSWYLNVDFGYYE